MTDKYITIIGSYNVGLFLKGDRLPVLGETIIAEEFIEGGGGKGSNQAVASVKLGADTRLIAKLGADKYGIDALAMYRRLGINTDMVTMDASIHSGISVILIDRHGDNLISVVPGANLFLSKDNIDSVEWVLKESFIVGFQLENDHDMVFYGIKKVHQMGVTTFLDPAPAVKLPDDLYRHITIIKPNETEAHILTDIEVKGVESAKAAGRWFLERGVKNAIITLGEEGAVLVTKEKSEHFPAAKVNAVDTTGSGDIFSGGLLSSLSQGKSMEEAIVFANSAASISTTKLGVIEAIPALSDVEDFMKR